MESPVPISTRSGCKVDWATYKTRAEAEAVAESAKARAAAKEARGYDFGYQSPGSITEVEGGFEVCLP